MKAYRSGILPTAILGMTLLTGMALNSGKPGELKSGVDKGGTLLPFHPMHVTGADKGSTACPV